MYEGGGKGMKAIKGRGRPLKLDEGR